jgi:hypothetical protein
LEIQNYDNKATQRARFSTMNLTKLTTLLFAQQGGTAYMVGQIVGVIFLLVLAGAILQRVLKKK